MLERKTKVAVIGTGQIATKAHIPAYRSNKHVDLVAVVDIDKRRAEKIAKRFRIRKTFSSVDELLETQDVDAISICTPPNTHAEIAVHAFEHGVHVFCEKPMAIEVGDGKRMFEASPANYKVGGIPILSILGILCLPFFILLLYFYATNPAYGATTPLVETTITVLWIIPAVIYGISYYYHKTKGIDITLSAKEIPPL